MAIMTADEREFAAWLESIEFVDKRGRVLTTTLTDDESDDPEGDAQTEEE
jgi:hypothetical protein